MRNLGCVELAPAHRRTILLLAQPIRNGSANDLRIQLIELQEPGSQQVGHFSLYERGRRYAPIEDYWNCFSGSSRILIINHGHAPMPPMFSPSYADTLGFKRWITKI